MKMPAKSSQKSILAGVVRKRVATDDTNGAIGTEDKSKVETVPAKISKPNENTDDVDSNAQSAVGVSSSMKIDLSVHDRGALKCIGILPGIGKYKDSSDSEKSTDTDDEYDFSDYDWVGRKVKKDLDGGCHDD